MISAVHQRPIDDLDAVVTRGLMACEAALAAYEHEAVARFGTAALGVIDMPDLRAGDGPSPEQVRVASVLLWIRELEGTGLVAFVDRLAEPSQQMTFPFSTQAVRLLHGYRQHARHSPSMAERHAWYQLVFSAPFPAMFETLVDRLVAWNREPRQAKPPTTGLHTARQALAQQLSQRVQGAVQYGVDGTLRRISYALRVLRHPDVRQALGAGGTFDLIQRHAPRVLGRAMAPSTAAIARAASGATLVAWVAGGGPLATQNPVLSAAEVWVAHR